MSDPTDNNLSRKMSRLGSTRSDRKASSSSANLVKAREALAAKRRGWKPQPTHPECPWCRCRRYEH